MIYVEKKIEGYECLPDDIATYLKLFYIKHVLYGPNGNIQSSWQQVEASHRYNQVEENVIFREVCLTARKIEDRPKQPHPWRQYKNDKRV